MADTLTLKVGGLEHRHWTSISVTSGMEQAASSFTATLVESRDGATDSPIGVKAGAQCEVWLGIDRIFTGWIDGVEASANGEDRSFTVDGRSLTCDLIDCSAAPAQFKRLTLAQIAGALAIDYDVTVSDLAGLTDTYRAWRPQHGETVFEALDRLARGAQVLLTDDPEGRLVITRLGATRGADITESLPILSQRCRVDRSQVYSVYEVRGQARGDDQNYAAAVAHGYGEVDDDSVNRIRRLSMRAETGQGYAAACIARATNEAVTRAGRSVVVDVEVGGWRDAGGDVWAKGASYYVNLPMLKVDGDLVLSTLTLSCDEGGPISRLTLVPPGMFEFVEPTKRPARKKITKAAEVWIDGEVSL